MNAEERDRVEEIRNLLELNSAYGDCADYLVVRLKHGISELLSLVDRQDRAIGVTMRVLVHEPANMPCWRSKFGSCMYCNSVDKINKILEGRE